MTAATFDSTAAVRSSKARTSRTVIAGRVLSAIAIVLMAMDASMKLLGVKEAIEGTVQLGFNANTLLPLGIIQMTCLVLYAIPRTAPIGALLFTGYLGGAVAIHVQHGNPLFSHILSPVYVALFLWGGLYLRDARLRNVITHNN